LEAEPAVPFFVISSFFSSPVSSFHIRTFPGIVIKTISKRFVHDQNLDLQRDALEKAGCEKFFQHIASGTKDKRKGLIDAIEFARKGDIAEEARKMIYHLFTDFKLQISLFRKVQRNALSSLLKKNSPTKLCGHLKTL
jgi:hypothetical protein